MTMRDSFRPADGRAYGFTLLEVMIVVAIVAILTAIALPTYRTAVLRGNRADAKAVLMESAQYMERYFTTHNTFAGATPGTAVSAVSPKGATASGGDIKYNIGFATGQPTASTFIIQADPANGQVGDPCGRLTLSNTGVQTDAGASAPKTPGCW